MRALLRGGILQGETFHIQKKDRCFENYNLLINRKVV